MSTVVITDGWHDDYEFDLPREKADMLADQGIIFPLDELGFSPDKDKFGISFVISRYQADGGEITFELTTDEAVERFEQHVRRLDEVLSSRG